MNWPCTNNRLRSIILVGACALTACAAADKRANEPKSPSSEASAGAAPPGYSDQPAAQAGYPAPPPMPVTPAATASAPAPPPAPTRQAGSDLDRAQRELDVAAGDCQNACRALSSMDRAAGRICSLSSGSDDDQQRCSDAKTRVYSARDKVKNSCGKCPETSVDHNAPVPSTK